MDNNLFLELNNLLQETQAIDPFNIPPGNLSCYSSYSLQKIN